MAFQKAQRQRVYIKIAVTGPSGSGKTFSSLKIGFGLGSRVAVIDTENDSASLYADLGDYDVMTIHAPFTVQKYTDAIREAVSAGYDVLVIDSLSHVWAADGGLLAQKEAKDARGGNSYTNWADISKQHEQLKAAILQSAIHIIATMRSKQDYVIETDQRGKSAPRKVGLAPVQREGMEYEFTTVFDVDMSHCATTSKDRTGLFTDAVAQITEEYGTRLAGWLAGGAEVATPVQAVAPAPAPSTNGNGRHTKDDAIAKIRERGQKVYGTNAVGTTQFNDYLGRKGIDGIDGLKDADMDLLVSVLAELKAQAKAAPVPVALPDTPTPRH